MNAKNVERQVQKLMPRMVGPSISDYVCCLGPSLSNGEVHYLWWYIQGSIMSPFVREKLRKAWGMCTRHAWAAIFVESSYRSGYLHGPAVLYEDLMGRAAKAFEMKGPLRLKRAVHKLRNRGPCLMCEMELGPNSSGMASPHLLDKGKDWSVIKALALRTRAYWERMVCGKCAKNDSPMLCRQHLIENQAKVNDAGFVIQKGLVEKIERRVRNYSRSFRWEYRGTETEEDPAGLLAAVGWCSGWGPLLRLVGF